MSIAMVLLEYNLHASIAPLYYKKIIDMIGNNQGELLFNDFIPTFIVLFIIILAQYVSRQYGDVLTTKILASVSRDVNQSTYDELTKKDYTFYANNFLGSLASKFSKFGRAFHTIYDTLIWHVLATGSSLIIMFIILFRENVYLGLCFSAWAILYGVINVHLVKKQSELEEIRSRKETKLSGFVSDVLTNILNIKIFSSSRNERKLFDEVNDEMYQSRLDAWRYSDKVSFITRGIQVSFRYSIVVLGVYFWSRSYVSAGTIVLLLMYSSQVSMQLTHLGYALKRFIEGISDAIEIIEISEQVNQVQDPVKINEQKTAKGTINFNSITFDYPEGEKVFKDFNLCIPHGQSIGIVGSSGSGKTTITKLLLRFFDVSLGSICVDGQDIRTINQDDLRNIITYIPQEAILFHRSIYENIAYARPNASREDVIHATRLAHADEFIENLHNTYDTLVGERGIKLSGGQRQRIAIARAMLRSDASILIMDEATSSLDSLSEEFIQESFDTLTSNRTTIVIAHRLSTVKKMNRIIVLKEGKIVEDGTHDELLEKKGEYLQLWNAQTASHKNDTLVSLSI